MTIFLEAQLKGTVPLRKAKQFDNGIVLLGASYCRPFTSEERFLIDHNALYGPASDGKQAEFFTKAIVCDKVLHCQQYTCSSRRKNSIVGLFNGHCCGTESICHLERTVFWICKTCLCKLTLLAANRQ